MERFEDPELEVIKLEDDVICTSCTWDNSTETPEL